MSRMNSEAVVERNVSVPLGIGIALVPGLFVWFLLRRGYGTAARATGFGWAGLMALFYFSAIGNAPTSKPIAATTAKLDTLQQSARTSSADPVAPWPEDGDGFRVTKAGFQSRNLVWPLTVQSGIVGCKHPELLWLEVDGSRYGLNGMGQIHLKLSRFDDVWAIDNSLPGATGSDKLRLSPSDLLAEARKLCD